MRRLDAFLLVCTAAGPRPRAQLSRGMPGSAPAGSGRGEVGSAADRRATAHGRRVVLVLEDAFVKGLQSLHVFSPLACEGRRHEKKGARGTVVYK